MPNESRSVSPRRKPNAEGKREYLTDAEVARLSESAKNGRHGHRDATIILVAYVHGLRVSELVGLQWRQIDFASATLMVRRTKRGLPSIHQIEDEELRALRKLQREQEPKSTFVFTSQRGSPFTPNGVARMVERAGNKAGLGFKAHPQMLRHACGYARANKGYDAKALQSYLGLKTIDYAVRYTELSADRYRHFWRS